MIHPETKFFSYEPVKPDSLCASIILWWGGQRTDIPIPKGSRTGNREGLTGPKQGPELGSKSHWIRRLEIPPLGLDALPSHPVGAVVLPPGPTGAAVT